ncbi:AAA-like domain-containing protein [Clostridium sp. YIM B02555]|uniref:AAA-like domain-containing protein n=1 Tax=Clostridium sp. YIM B02555 TaxID=2911968 RepID=UPI001EEDD332|nr:AAA-like domain-containing protein [Clostridium sp. YIM B02555]
MEKEFNVTGTCVPEIHYIVDTSNKLEKVIKLIEKGKYFIINRPRQYGKTTALFMLEKTLTQNEEYSVISISFEGIGDLIFEDETKFSKGFLKILQRTVELENLEIAEFIDRGKEIVENLDDLSSFITKLIKKINKKVVLMIDEVDKSSNNQLFLSFLGMLRNKYLLRNVGKDYTFYSVILAGVHDVKTLKVKIRPDEEQKYNSPWNIASDFDIDMSFSKEEIGTMLVEYAKCNDLTMNVAKLSDRIYFFTSGYPFLVSKICKTLDEKIYPYNKKNWNVDDIDKAVKLIIGEVNTLFESIVKNLENNEELYDLVKRLLINGEIILFNVLDPLINLGLTYGIFKQGINGVEISNKIFEEIIYNYMLSKSRTTYKDMSKYNFKDKFIANDGGLCIEKILLKFQQFIREQYSHIDASFIEREGRLLFLAFIKPIINGVGFDFKEVQISEEKRLDIVITYNSFKYIIELKVWRGEKYHKRGVEQLSDYLDINHMNKGFLLVFNFNRNKEYKKEVIIENDKEILTVYV